jgi:hypothetical protein
MTETQIVEVAEILIQYELESNKTGKVLPTL